MPNFGPRRSRSCRADVGDCQRRRHKLVTFLRFSHTGSLTDFESLRTSKRSSREDTRTCFQAVHLHTAGIQMLKSREACPANHLGTFVYFDQRRDGQTRIKLLSELLNRIKSNWSMTYALVDTGVGCQTEHWVS